MANIKISQLTAKAANLATTDLFEVSVVSGLSYVSKKITGQEIIDGVISYIGTPTLQTVTDEGNITTNSIVVGDTSSYYSQISNISLRAEDNAANTYAYIGVSGLLGLGNGTFESQLQNTNVTNTGVVLRFPNKTCSFFTVFLFLFFNTFFFKSHLWLFLFIGITLLFFIGHLLPPLFYFFLVYMDQDLLLFYRLFLNGLFFHL